MAAPRIGLALGSGSARGWSHIGVIEALSEAGSKPTSSAEPRWARWSARLMSLDSCGAARMGGECHFREIVGLVDVRLSGGGLIDGKVVVTFLRKLGVEAPIESHKKRFAAVATDLVSGREVWLNSGPIYEVVRASIALPEIFSPAQLNGKWFVDGGLSNPVPVSVWRALGADVIIAVNLNGELLGRRFASDPGRTRRRPLRLSPTNSSIACSKGFRHRCASRLLRSFAALAARSLSRATSACSQTHSISCRTTSRGTSLASRLMSCLLRDCATSLCWSSTAERRQLPKAIIALNRHCRC